MWLAPALDGVNCRSGHVRTREEAFATMARIEPRCSSPNVPILALLAATCLPARALANLRNRRKLSLEIGRASSYLFSQSLG